MQQGPLETQRTPRVTKRNSAVGGGTPGCGEASPRSVGQLVSLERRGESLQVSHLPKILKQAWHFLDGHLQYVSLLLWRGAEVGIGCDTRCSGAEKEEAWSQCLVQSHLRASQVALWPSVQHFQQAPSLCRHLFHTDFFRPTSYTSGKENRPALGTVHETLCRSKRWK